MQVKSQVESQVFFSSIKLRVIRTVQEINSSRLESTSLSKLLVPIPHLTLAGQNICIVVRLQKVESLVFSRYHSGKHNNTLVAVYISLQSESSRKKRWTVTLQNSTEWEITWARSVVNRLVFSCRTIHSPVEYNILSIDRHINVTSVVFLCLALLIFPCHSVSVSACWVKGTCRSIRGLQPASGAACSLIGRPLVT